MTNARSSPRSTILRSPDDVPHRDQLNDLVDTDPLRLRDAALALLARIEQAEDDRDGACGAFATAADQHAEAEAAIDRARALATNATRTECGAGWTLNPAEVLAALDRPEEST